MKKGWSTGKIVGVILGSIAAVIILWAAFVISLFQLVDFLNEIEESSDEEYEWSFDYDDPEEYENPKGADAYKDERDKEKDAYSYGGSTEKEYYDFENAIRDDLNYQVTFRSYEKGDYVSERGMGEIILDFEYPVVTGDVPNLDGINRAIYEEIEEVDEYLASAAGLLSDEDIYVYMGECYVTYMSEEILSIAYVEYGYLNDTYLESYVISYNFDMQTGMVLGNTHLVYIDDSFSIDFRERCENQNGEIDALSYMSDQEITAYLTDDDYLIIFYTPLGMEIGFNYYDGWVTVTYQDYEQYMRQF